jgi:hypothetical protein
VIVFVALGAVRICRTRHTGSSNRTSPNNKGKDSNGKAVPAIAAISITPILLLVTTVGISVVVRSGVQVIIASNTSNSNNSGTSARFYLEPDGIHASADADAKATVIDGASARAHFDDCARTKTSAPVMATVQTPKPNLAPTTPDAAPVPPRTAFPPLRQWDGQH